MSDCQLKRERNQAVFAVTITAVSMPVLVLTFLQGVQWPVLVYTLGFMAGYIVERIRVFRRIARLLRQLPASSGGVT